ALGPGPHLIGPGPERPLAFASRALRRADRQVSRLARAPRLRAGQHRGAELPGSTKLELASRLPLGRTIFELFAAEGDDEDVAVAGLRRIERLDRRDAVKDAVVIGEGGVERLGQGEAAQRLFRKIMDARLAALH